MNTVDLTRIFLGDLSLGFAFEIVLRTTIIYLYALVLMRVLGRRTTQNMTTFEVLIVIALGAAVGDPMFYPDVPILTGVIVITLVMGLEHLLAFLLQRLPALNRFVATKPRMLIVDGRLDQAGLRRAALGIHELFAELRIKGVAQLGEVKCAYLEEGGVISIFCYANGEIRPGLPIVPPWELRSLCTYEMPNPVPHAGVFVCCHCGQRLDYTQDELFLQCPTCAKGSWTEAVIEVGAPELTDIVR